MNGWTQQKTFWFLSLPEAKNASSKELHIYSVDEFTEDECRRYNVHFDPDANFALYVVYDKPVPEFAIESLHTSLREAMEAGQKWLEDFDARIDKNGRYE